MARVILWCALALATATLGSGARYSDYTDVKMPEYGSAIDYDGPRDSPPAPPPEPDEYHEHAPDASAPIDYNEEDRDKPKKHLKEVVESDEWRKSIKKHKNYLDNDEHDNFDSYSPEESNFKSKHMPSKQRLRLKPKHPEEEDLSEVHNNHVVRYGTSKKKYISELESKGSIDRLEDGFEDDKRIDFDEDLIKRRKNHRETTVKKVRRKPRDRFIKSEPTPDLEGYPIMDIRRRPVKDELGPESVTHPRTLVRRPQMRQGAGPDAKTGFGQRGYLPENNDDYEEYYDMRRVQNVKEKLMKEQIDDSPRPTTTMTATMRTRAARVAERELTALLSPRGVVSPLAAPPPPQPRARVLHEPRSQVPVNAALAADAMDPLHEDQWSTFITTNNSKRLQPLLYEYIFLYLVLLNFL